MLCNNSFWVNYGWVVTRKYIFFNKTQVEANIAGILSVFSQAGISVMNGPVSKDIVQRLYVTLVWLSVPSQIQQYRKNIQ